MSTDTTSANSLIQEQLSSIIVEPLEAESVLLKSGPKIFDSAEPLLIPTIKSEGTIGWVGENEKIPDNGTTEFGEIELMPTSRKSLKAIERVSNELIRAAKQGVTGTLQARLVKRVADTLDTALLTGDGANDTITGLLNQPGLETAPMSTTDTDPFLDALALAASKEVTPNRFILNGSDFYALRKLKDKNGRYVMQAGPADSAPFTLFDIPVTITNKIAPGKGVLANMNDVAVVRDTNPTVTILNERYAEYDQVGIRVTTRFDLGLIRPESVILLNGAAEA